MTITDRNFYRLLRAGAFGRQELIEPLSAWKWRRVYQLAAMHDVASYVYRGIERCREQFFVQVPEALLAEWAATPEGNENNDNELLQGDRLTNPLLNHHLQNILDGEQDASMETRQMLIHLIAVSRFVMNAGIPVKRLTELGLFLQQAGGRTDYDRLAQWTARLRMDNMVQLTALMLKHLLHFADDELPFMRPCTQEVAEAQIEALLSQKNSHAEDWYFSQGKDIFVHTANSQAMLWHVRRAAKSFRYYPAESVTNFFSSFAHSLSHIEE